MFLTNIILIIIRASVTDPLIDCFILKFIMMYIYIYLLLAIKYEQLFIKKMSFVKISCKNFIYSYEIQNYLILNTSKQKNSIYYNHFSSHFGLI